jgi:ribonuclease BN (tRNA processing enzyme)
VDNCQDREKKLKEVSLCNKKDISVTILGSGTCVPSLKRSSCSVLIETGKTKILIDCGSGTIRRLLENGTQIYDISHILISHFHPDHTGELVSFLFANKYPDGNRRKIPLSVVGGPGISDFYAGLKAVFGNWIDLKPNALDIIELDADKKDIRLEDAVIKFVPVEHNEESLAYRIFGNNNCSVVYSGDTDYCNNIVEISCGANLLICESALPDELKVKGHLTPSIAGDIATKAKVQKLLLTHFYPECDIVDIMTQCRKTYSGELIIAEDLMKICLP